MDKLDSLENVLDDGWKGVRVIESSASESSDSSSHGFNYDSLYLIEVRGLPWSATRQEIQQFFSGCNLLNGKDGIHFIIGENRKCGRAFIQFEQLRDYQLAQKYHMKQLDDQYVEGISVIICKILFIIVITICVEQAKFHFVSLCSCVCVCSVIWKQSALQRIGGKA